MRVKAKTRDYQLMVKVRLPFRAAVDTNLLGKFSRIFLRGFLNPKTFGKNKIYFTGPVGISLRERLRRPITKRDFLFVLEQLVVAVEKLQAHELPLKHLVTDISYVYINEVTKEIRFLYVPLLEGKMLESLLEMIESIVYSAKPAGDDDEFASRFVYYFKAMNPFDIAQVEQFVAREDKSVVDTIRKQNAGESGFMTDKPQHYYNHYDGKNQLDDEATGLLADDDETGLLQEEGTALLDDKSTGWIVQVSEAIAHCPSLYRQATGENIRVDKPVFRLGKERSYVDYFVANNIAVSRSHADLITRGSRCYVKDLNSKNHTYINDSELPAHCEIEIHEGDRLKLGNEEFIFHE